MKKLFSLVILVSSLLGRPAYAGFKDLVFDKEDGMLDLSALLNSNWGFMPVVIPITEPALGYGAAAAGIWFHDQLTKNAYGKLYLPSVSGLVVLGTENGSRGYGGFHMENWVDDTWGYTGFVFDGDINLQVYSSDSGEEFSYNLKGFLTSHQITRSVARNLSIGLGYQYSSAVVSLPGFDLALEDENAAVEVELAYDALDNPISPMNGLKSSITYEDYNERWGGESNFSKGEIQGQYHKGFNQWHFGVNLSAKYADGDTPFYMLPFVGLRGVPAMSYIGSDVYDAELELGYQFSRRWSAVVFGGVGRAEFPKLEVLPISTTSEVSTVGVGFRYLIASEYGMHSGVDVAFNSDDGSAIYFQVGSAW